MAPRAFSVATSFDYSIPLAEQFTLIREAGFSHVSLGVRADHSGLFELAGRARIARLSREYGLPLDTIHAASPCDNWIGRLSQTIDAAAELAVPTVVVHPGAFNFPAERLQSQLCTLLRTCEAVLPLAERRSVRLALENVMPGPASELICRALETFPTPYLGFCYDSSHDQIGGLRPPELLARLHSRLVAVHLSDRIADFKDHVVPGEGFIDFDSICRWIAASPFDAPLLMEVMVTHSRFKESSVLLREAQQAGARLADGIFREREGDGF